MSTSVRSRKFPCLTVLKASCSILAAVAGLVSNGGHAQVIGEAETVLITGQRTSDEVGAGILGERPVLETPVSVTGYTAALILDQGARSTSEVLANDPSVRVQTPGDGNYDFFSIRGFSMAASAFALNGLYGVLPWNTMSPEAVEQFEVIRGPATTFSGAAPFDNPGGTINIQPKRAGAMPLTRFTGIYDFGGQAGLHADIGRRFGANGEWGVRVNAVYRNGGLARDHQSEEVALFTIGADYTGERFRVSLDAGHQKFRTDGANFLFHIYEGTDVPEAPETDDNVYPEWSFADSRDTYAAARAEFDITPALTFFAAAGTRDHESSIVNPYTDILDGDGNLYVYPYQEAYFADTKWSAEAGLRATFDTGPLNHRLVAAVSGVRFDTGWLGTYSEGVVVPPGFDEYESNLYNPVFPQAPSLVGVPENGELQLENKLTSYAFADTISVMGGRYQLTVGIRRQDFEIHRLYDPVTPVYDDGRWAPAVGLLARVTNTISVYANYMTGLSQGQFAPVGTENQNEQFAPEETKQYEIGVKAQWGGFFTSLAWFDISQPAGLIDPVTNIFSIDGKQRHRGFEWTFVGEVVPRVRVLGGVNYIDAELESTAGGVLDGNTAPGVPDFTANIGGEVDIGATGFTLTGRVVYTSDAYVFADNLQAIPEWTRLDLGARYAFVAANRLVTLRLNAINVTGEDYWASAQGSGLSLGAPRSVLFSATVDF